MSPALAGGFFTTSATWEAPFNSGFIIGHIYTFFWDDGAVFSRGLIFFSDGGLWVLRHFWGAEAMGGHGACQT